MPTQAKFRSAFVLLAFLAGSSVLAQTQSTSPSARTARGDNGPADSMSAFALTDMYPGDDNATMERSRFTPVKRQHLRPQPVNMLDMGLKHAASAPDERFGFDAAPVTTPGDESAGFGNGLPFFAEMERAGGGSRPWGRYSATPGATGAFSGSGRRCPPTGTRDPLERVTRPTTMLGDAPAALQGDRIRLLNAQPKP
jgi:hypothetical protein